MCEHLQKLTSVKTDWTWKRMYQNLYERVKKVIKKVACMKLYEASRPLYVETDVLDVSFGARLLQVGDSMNCKHDKVPDNAKLYPTAFASKSPLSAG